MPSERYVILDSLRGLAAISVVVFHASQGLSTLVSGFYISVDFFFVLSGFVLAKKLPGHNLDASGSSKEFLRHRFVRIWTTLIPALTASLALSVTAAFMAGPSGNLKLDLDEGQSLLSFLAAAALLQIFISAAISWNVPLWSLSAEWWVNVVVSLSRQRDKFLGLLGFSVMGLFLVHLGMNMDSPWISENGPIRGFEAFGRALYGFSLGVMGFNFNPIRPVLRPVAYISLGLTSLLTCYVLATSVALSIEMIYFAAPLFTLSVCSFARLESLIEISATFTKLATKIGALSFGVYVWQAPVMHLAGSLYFDVWSKDNLSSVLFFVAISVALALIAASFATKVLEPRVGRWLRVRLLGTRLARPFSQSS